MSGSPSTPADKLPSLAGLRVLVVGLGRFGGGVGVSRWLAGEGAKVTVTDRAGGQTLAASIDALADLPVTYHMGGHDPGDLDSTDLVIINPAVDKSRSELFQAVVRRGMPWTTEMNLFCERCPATIIGVTGSYGKSTTCAMLGDALEACRRADSVKYIGVHLGGNIGRSLLTELDGIRSCDLVVLEMSNAQLEDLPRIDWAPPVALITNLAPHHMDRYGCYAKYLAAKLNIVRDPAGVSKVIVGDIDADAEAALRRAVSDCAARLLCVTRPEPAVELCIPGEHNQANAACVLAVCHHLGVNETVVRNALRSFEGLPHRLERIRVLDGVDYYNDSKSTSPAATVRAVETLSRPIVAIIGGQDKGVSFTECARALARVCRMVICVGESGPLFARAVRAAAGQSAEGAAREVDGLETAVELARAHAVPGDVVLFSPGAPSFDAYANFADRGHHFVEIVNLLPSAAECV